MERYDVLIIGAGPAGLFCADYLNKQGVQRILMVDSGRQISQRKCPKTPECDCAVCAILEGEGGAGGYSDGKKTYSLGRGTQMEEIFKPEHSVLLEHIDQTIVSYGGAGWDYVPLPDQPDWFRGSKFRFDTYPLRHIGTDGARRLIAGHTKDLRSWGVRIQTNVDVVHITTDDSQACGAILRDRFSNEEHVVLADTIIVAAGLQGIPWFEKECAFLGLPLKCGPAGIGMRFEAPASTLRRLFTEFYDFKLVYDYKGRLFRSFCCNQQGWITNENHRTLGVRNVNGHSFLDPSMRTNSSNFAIIAKVEPDDLITDPQRYVRRVARSINRAASDGTAVQRAVDFVNGVPSTGDQIIETSTLTNVQSRSGVDIGSAMPLDLYQGFRSFLVDLDKVVSGVLQPNSLVYAPEVKYLGYKTPVDFGSWEVQSIKGLYVTGAASGYLDSFVSAALSGILAAMDIVAKKEA